MEPTNPKNVPAPENQRRRPLACRIIRWTAVALGVIVLIVMAAITIAVSYLTPQRLTPLVEREASAYLNADVRAGRVEISFYSTFPRFELEIDSLDVRTRAFDSLPRGVRDSLPSWADSLLRLDGLRAAVNIPKLLKGSVELYDVTLNNPVVNVVQATPEVSGLDIFPAPDEEKGDDGPMVMPDFSFDRFRVDSVMVARYVSLPDTTDVAVALRTLSLDGEGAPLYALDIAGATEARVAALRVPLTRFGIDGKIGWDPHTPSSVSLSDMALRVADVTATLSTDLSVDSVIRVNTLEFTLPQTPLSSFIEIIPEEMRGELARVDARLSVGLQAMLKRPYEVGGSTLPWIDVKIEVPEGSAAYDGMKLDRFALRASASVNGDNPDASVLDVDRLFAMGEGIGFEVDGRVTTPLTDPTVSGRFRGGLSVAKLPRRLLSMVPGTVKGVLKADCSFDLRRSWLDRDNFHRVRLAGEATLTDLDVDMPELPLAAFSRRMELRFGTTSSFTRGTQSVDSLLTASLRVDTLSFELPGMELRAAELALGAGCKNTGSITDTTQINPIGGRVAVGRLSFRSEADSLRLYLRKATAGVSLTRFKGHGRAPRLTMDIATERAFYADAINRAFLSDARTGLTVHPSTSASNLRRLARLDSLRRVYPDVSRDSLLALARGTGGRRRGVRSDTVAAGEENLDIEVDGSIRRLLRRWEARGGLKASRVMAYTPLFPLRSRISDLSLRFNTDSVVVADTRVRVGHSDFLIDGSISNIAKALTSRRGGEPLKVNLNLRSDTINVNEIAAAVFAGAAFAERNTGGTVSEEPAPDFDDETSVGPASDVVADTAMALLIIPSNLEATLDVCAANIMYSDLVFRDFHGVLNAYQGALNLSEMAASTDVGSLNLNALYSASSRTDGSFAFGLRLKDFHIGEFLDLIPAIDSLMPLLQTIDGVINADLAATTAIDSGMNIDIPSLKAAVKIAGDSLVVLDDETFRTIGKWLLFKNKNRNMIDSMTVEMIIDDSRLQMFPFMFNFDRYKLGVSGSNDLAMNLNYHVAVLKSPLPFKFGINISGNPDDMKIRVGRAKFNEKEMTRSVSIADTTRINLVREIGNVFRRGVRRSSLKRLDFTRVGRQLLRDQADAGDTISRADSLYFIREGVLPAPPPAPETDTTDKNKKKNKRR